MPFHTLDQLDLNGKTVLTRVDLNVPVVDGQVTDTTRIDKIGPTVADILSRGGKPVLLAHFGRPEGKRDENYSLRVVLPALVKSLGVTVRFADDCIGAPAKKAVAALVAGEVLLLENTRFHPGEETNSPAFAASLAALGDVFVNDAFSAAHRAHASTEGIARLLPNAAGRLMEAELSALNAALGDPERPVVAIVGGAKVSTKLGVLLHLIEKVDVLVIGGGMANTVLFAQGNPIGKSLAERDLAEKAREILARAVERGCTILLPRDIVTATEFAAHAATRTLPAGSCPDDAMILDAGPETVAQIGKLLEGAKTLLWNGPLGAFETPPFDAATLAIAHKVADLTAAGKLVSVGGGGDTVAALNAAGVGDKLTFLSTAGGAFLEWMEGRVLPGVAALEPD